MKRAKFTNTVVVECPYCNGENEIQISEMGEGFECSYSHCEEFFSIPTFNNYLEDVLGLGLSYYINLAKERTKNWPNWKRDMFKPEDSCE